MRREYEREKKWFQKQKIGTRYNRDKDGALHVLFCPAGRLIVMSIRSNVLKRNTFGRLSTCYTRTIFLGSKLVLKWIKITIAIATFVPFLFSFSLSLSLTLSLDNFPVANVRINKQFCAAGHFSRYSLSITFVRYAHWAHLTVVPPLWFRVHLLL